MSYNPITDEKKAYTLREFEKEAKDALSEYVNDLEGANDFAKTPHTFNEWMVAFARFMSW